MDWSRQIAETMQTQGIDENKAANNLMNLFMVYVGGYTVSSNIELHDMRFVIGETIESCYPQLLQEWWGEKNWIKPHKDNLFEVEKVLELSQVENKYIHLKKSTKPECFEFECEYKLVTYE